MRFDIREVSAEDATEYAGWRYASPYDVYMADGAPPAAISRALYNETGMLCGLFSWGDDARVAEAADLYAEHPNWLDFGIGLRPDLTGQGIGLFACDAALSWLRGKFHPPCFRLAVYEWNVRAQRVYTRLGFAPLTKRGDFLMMARDERPWREASRPLVNDMPIYPGDPPFSRVLAATHTDGGFDVSQLSMGAHTGTHVDSPAHIGLSGGTDTLSVDLLADSVVQVVDWPNTDMSSIRSPYVLLRTGGRGLSLSEATTLHDIGIRLLGIDGMSVGNEGEGLAVHKLLLEAGISIVENIALESFVPGWYEMRCLPLLLLGSDGAPARILLREVHT